VGFIEFPTTITKKSFFGVDTHRKIQIAKKTLRNLLKLLDSFILGAHLLFL
jgi:hypothetical protein